MDINNYSILGSTQKYQGPKIQVNSLKIKTCEGNIVEWDQVELPNFVYALPVTQDQQVILKQEWRPGPETVLTQTCGARFTSGDGTSELKKELSEELGLEGGKYKCILNKISNGPHFKGFITVYAVTDSELYDNHTEPNEIVRIIKLPLKGLFQTLTNGYTTTAITLLAAMLMEENTSPN